MNIIQQYLEIVPLPVLLLGFFGAVLIAILIPPRLRLPIGMFLLPVWLTMSQAIELGTVFAIATATAPLLYIYLIVAATFDPQPKRRMPSILWLYPILGVVSCFLVLSTVDYVHALAVQIQWILMSVAAIFVVRTVTDSASLLRVVKPFILGVAIALLIPLSDVILAGEAVIGRVGRFWPWGANPNQMGLIFSLAIPLGLYAMLVTKHLPTRVFFGAMASVGLAMALLTASRSVLFVAVIASIPVALTLGRRPVVAVGLGILGFGIFAYVFGDIVFRFERYTTLETARTQLFLDYLERATARPITGLLGTDGYHFISDPTARTHMHNAYLLLFYHGGAMYFLAYFALVVYTLYCAFQVWRKRTVFGHDTLLTSLLVFSVIGVYAHGFVNMSIYYSTYLWAFWHVMLSCMVIILAHDLREHAASPLSEAPEPVDLDQVDMHDLAIQRGVN